MTLWTQEFHDVAELRLGKVYDHKWWGQEFANAHPGVTFLMQILNRHVVAPSKDYAEELRKTIGEQDAAVAYAMGKTPAEFLGPTDLARLALTAFMLEERTLGLRFAMSSVMTAEDSRDFALLLSGVNDDRARSS